jgi:Lipid A 3-O-deacylase (PagL)
VNRVSKSVPVLTACLCARIVLGGSEVTPHRLSAIESRSDFSQGLWEFEETTGAFFSLNSGFGRPKIDYAVETLRLGVMLSNPHGSGVFAGNFEFLLDVLGGVIFQGPGNGLGGGTMGLRYNFVQPQASLVPFVQLGAGGCYSDIAESPQELLGSHLNFLGQASIGVRSRFSQRWSAILQANYNHMSNAGLTTRNDGLDAIGGTVGLGYNF